MHPTLAYGADDTGTRELAILNVGIIPFSFVSQCFQPLWAKTRGSITSLNVKLQSPIVKTMGHEAVSVYSTNYLRSYYVTIGYSLILRGL